MRFWSALCTVLCDDVHCGGNIPSHGFSLGLTFTHNGRIFELEVAMPEHMVLCANEGSAM